MNRPRLAFRHVCSVCGVNVGNRGFGWRHQNNGRTGKIACNSVTIIPVERPAEIPPIERLRQALTPSASTKAAYLGEFAFTDDTGRRVIVPWVTIKEILAAVRERAK